MPLWRVSAINTKEVIMSTRDIQTSLQRIHDILVNHPGDSADWIASIIGLAKTDESEFYRLLNTKRMWGGAGSIASQALEDNPGIDDWTWKMNIREFRELMIELGQHLQARGSHYPDISSWLLAYSNWNQSEI
ncbi:MAG: hypothetical protein ACN4GM_06525 [Gammaproteobacteria bacterium]